MRLRAFHLSILLAPALLVAAGCATEQEVDLRYALSCSDCGATRDRVLDVQLDAEQRATVPATIRIRNLTDSVLILEPLLFSSTFENIWEGNAIGAPDQPGAYARSFTSSSGGSAAEGQFAGRAFRSHNSSSGTTVTDEPLRELTLPPRATMPFRVKDPIARRFWELVARYPDWPTSDDDRSMIESGVSKHLRRAGESYSIVYHVMNEAKQRSASIHALCEEAAPKLAHELTLSTVGNLAIFAGIVALALVAVSATAH
jgi:hypothetical protein